MKSKLSAACLLTFSLLILLSACGNTASQKNIAPQTNENQTEMAESVKKLEIYAADVAVSARAIDRYSLSDGGEIILKSYVFDNNCKFYDVNGNEVDFNEFAHIINQSYSSDSKMTKCRLVYENKLVVEAYIVKE